jgi:crotonobetainyl-CoA:carnitine CoA-transferase CaiB-like acyl-CoA transferase
VRTSLLAAIVGVHAYQGTRYTVAGEVAHAQGNHHPSICPYGLFHAADGIVQISVGSEGLWRRFAAAFDLPAEAEGYASNADRVGNRDAVIAAVEKAFAQWPTDRLLPKLAEIGVPAGEVKTLDQVYSWEQTRSQGLVVDVEHASLGRITIPGPAIRLDDNAYAGGQETNLAPPTLGQHNDTVREWLDQVEASDATSTDSDAP